MCVEKSRCVEVMAISSSHKVGMHRYPDSQALDWCLGYL